MDLEFKTTCSQPARLPLTQVWTEVLSTEDNKDHLGRRCAWLHAYAAYFSDGSQWNAQRSGNSVWKEQKSRKTWALEDRHGVPVRGERETEERWCRMAATTVRKLNTELYSCWRCCLSVGQKQCSMWQLLFVQDDSWTRLYTSALCSKRNKCLLLDHEDSGSRKQWNYLQILPK